MSKCRHYVYHWMVAVLNLLTVLFEIWNIYKLLWIFFIQKISSRLMFNVQFYYKVINVTFMPEKRNFISVEFNRSLKGWGGNVRFFHSPLVRCIQCLVNSVLKRSFVSLSVGSRLFWPSNYIIINGNVKTKWFYTCLGIDEIDAVDGARCIFMNSIRFAFSLIFSLLFLCVCWEWTTSS